MTVWRSLLSQYY